MCCFGAHNAPFALMNFFGKTNVIFRYFLVPSILQNFKEIVTADPELWHVIFGFKIAQLLWIIFSETNNIILMYILAFLIGENLKKSP